MVRAILEGRKTQTRRIMKPQLSQNLYATRIRYEQHPFSPSAFAGTPAEGRVEGEDRMSWVAYDWVDNPVGVEEKDWLKCPYGVPGDRLWVRETWHPAARLGTEYEIEYQADKSSLLKDAGWEGATPTIDRAIDSGWKPSIHMPRWASRLTLEIVSVRVERLQDITEEDAKAEGVEPVGLSSFNMMQYRDYSGESGDKGFHSPRSSYESLWEKINGAGSWDKNPWVWVVEFKKLEAQS